jgi:hypothetical protein
MPNSDDEIKRFEAALKSPFEAQEKLLSEILSHNKECAYGREYGFDRCTDYAHFNKQVPVVSYDDLQPFMQRVIDGEQNVLITDEVVYCGVSSGTSGRKKFIPIHRGFVEETKRWMAIEDYFVARALPGIRREEELRYVNRVEGQLDSGIPCGSVSAWYYGELVKRGEYREVVPYEVYQLGSVKARNYGFLRISLGADVTRITAVNPSTLLLIAQLMAKEGENLLRDVRDGGISHPDLPAEMARRLSERLPANKELASRIEESFKRDGELRPQVAWPKLKLLSCWIHGGAAFYRDDLMDTYGEHPVWDYGYTSTEGRVTVTFDEKGLGVPLITSSFLELRMEDGSMLPLVQAKEGQKGELVITTTRGLYRYTMGDVVEVGGHFEGVPLLRFKGKSSAVASLTGEKVTEEQVTKIVRAIAKEENLKLRFFCFAPVWGQPPGYHLLMEFAQGAPSPEVAQRICKEFEQRLVAANAEYERKRETLRLLPTAVRVLVPGSYDGYLDAQVAAGREIARIKTPRVTMDPEFAKQFEGKVVECE